jgi:hypothetical protein
MYIIATKWIMDFESIAGCIMFAGLGICAGFCEIWTITAISYDRYLVITAPFGSKRLSNLQVISKKIVKGLNTEIVFLLFLDQWHDCFDMVSFCYFDQFACIWYRCLCYGCKQTNCII